MAKEKKTDFEILIDLKLQMKSFLKKEENVRRKIDKTPDEKEFKRLQKELDLHISGFNALETALVAAEKKMINLDRGLYKGIGIDVRDKQYAKMPIYLKFANLNNHVGYTGTTRVGKTKNMISDAKQLIQKGWDVIIVDPKGGEGQEILTETIQASLESNRAEDFKFLSPAFPDESELVNLMFGMGDDEAASMIKTFAESISDDNFFTGVVYENTLAALKALTFIQAATDPFGTYTQKLEQEEIQRYIKLKNFKNFSQNVTMDKWNRTSNPNELHISTLKPKTLNENQILKKEASGTLYSNRSMVTFKTLSNYTTYDSLERLKTTISKTIAIPPVDRLGHELYAHISHLREEALSILDKVLSTDKANFSKIAKTHSVLLSQLVYGDIGKVFSGSGINIISNRLLSEDKGLICVMQPYPMRFKTVSNVSVMAMLKSIESMMGLVGSSGRGNKRRLAIMIDEAGAVMYKGIEDLFNKAGGLGVTLFIYTQSYEDYSLSLGPTNANVIMDNVNTPITMRMNHPESCKRAAESLGTIRKNQSMYMSNSTGGSRFSVGSEDEPIALPEDISELPVGTGFMRHDGNTYIVDFPYMKGLSNYPIKMPTLENERARRSIAEYESHFLQNLHGLSIDG
ncbi:TraM recognition domain-containing protein [Sulfurimonas sp.]|uniref:type IV secretory system conjugative DNA transfer family protein n=1 Tax=Sulfurimonas sp. TaxID=2022749 RepID=UPI0025EF57B8|nr:TraM recognition domain-containing protein [Sulfurimonas sp.]MBW6487474.1 TraM recognition domain-containing protein [Sulfurimonas sp.]